MPPALRALLPLALLAGCAGDQGGWGADGPLWDPNVIATNDGVYVRLPVAGRLVRVAQDGHYDVVDLDGAAPDDIVLAPDQSTLIVKASWSICNDDDPKIRTISDCDEEDRDTAWEVNVVRDGARIGSTAIPPEYNRFTFNEDGSLGAAFLDLTGTGGLDFDGVLSLADVVFFDLSNGDSRTVAVGFAPENVLFTPGGGRAVVLSRSEVAVVDLTTWTTTVSFPLTLDLDQEVIPTDVALTPDGRYAIVSAQGSADLYVLDLEGESIDLIELDGVPTDLLVDEVHDQTLIVYGHAAFDVLDHELFEVTTWPLAEATSQLLAADGKTLLYNGSGYGHDIYLFDPATEEVVEYQAENPVRSLQVTADNRYAVATMIPEGSGSGFNAYYGLAVVNLAGDERPLALALEDSPVGVALVENGGENYAMVLLNGSRTLYKVSLTDGAADPLELSGLPLGLTASPDGSFVIPQDSSVGLLTFLDPATGGTTDVTGFATSGMLPDYRYPRRDAAEE